MVTFGRWSSVMAGRLLCSYVDARVAAGKGRCVRSRFGACPGVGWRRCLQCPEVDGGRRVVAGAGGLAGFLDGVAVVPSAFDRAGAGTLAAFGVGPVGDLGEDCGQSRIPVLRGGKPPFRWRYGGPVAVCG